MDLPKQPRIERMRVRLRARNVSIDRGDSSMRDVILFSHMRPEGGVMIKQANRMQAGEPTLGHFTPSLASRSGKDCPRTEPGLAE
jgi:hypothetical protein